VVEGLQKIRDGTTVQPLTASELAAATQNLTPTGRTNSPKE